MSITLIDWINGKHKSNKTLEKEQETNGCLLTNTHGIHNSWSTIWSKEKIEEDKKHIWKCKKVSIVNFANIFKISYRWKEEILEFVYLSFGTHKSTKHLDEQLH